MNKTSKAFLGWTLICLMIAVFGGLGEGIATFVSGIGIYLIGAAIADWVGEIEANDRARDKDDRI
jgi:hypothetical protein